MKKQLLFIFILIITIYQVSAQKNRKFIYATIKNKIENVVNAHVINLNTKQGTFTNDNGEFRILAKENDSLQLSSVGYKTKTIVINTSYFGLLENNIELEKTTIELDEVILKKHNLFGILTRDLKQTPEDIAIAKSKGALDFSNIDFEKKVIEPIDVTNRSKAPDMTLVTDPTAKFAGVGGSMSSGLDKYSQELKRKRKEISYKERFPKLLLSEFGANFFYEKLKIPKESYYHFLEYCNPLGIEELYKKGKVLEVIKILQQESSNYLKLKNSDNK